MPGARPGIGPPKPAGQPGSRAPTGTLYRHRGVEASRRAQVSPERGSDSTRPRPSERNRWEEARAVRMQRPVASYDLVTLTARFRACRTKLRSLAPSAVSNRHLATGIQPARRGWPRKVVRRDSRAGRSCAESVIPGVPFRLRAGFETGGDARVASPGREPGESESQVVGTADVAVVTSAIRVREL